MAIELELVHEVSGTLTKALLDGLDFLGPGMAAKCSRWVREPAVVAQQRAELVAKRKTLDAKSTRVNALRDASSSRRVEERAERIELKRRSSVSRRYVVVVVAEKGGRRV